MARVGTYLNFHRNTEEAFLFYQSVFGGEFGRGGIVRFKDLPATDVSLQDMFWGSYYGTCTDRFGVQWMFSCTEK